MRTDSEKFVYTSQSSDQALQAKVSLVPKPAVNYDLGNTDWVKEDLVSLRQDETQYVNFEGGSNWYLTAKENSEGRTFCHFEVSNVVTDNQYDGFYARQSGKDNFNAKWWSLLCGAYIWYQEPHDVKYPENGFSANSDSANPGGGASAVILKMPNGNKWWDAAKIYDRSADTNNRSLCVTWANAGTGGDGWVQNQPNPLQDGTPYHGPHDIHNYYNPKIVAYDQYGNSGTFYLDGHDAQYGGTMKLYTSAPPAPY
ncbi:hypothetical protein A3Q37_05615 [Streptomyces sp. PTY087I2]|nr:hypothetical protein A3Q37_05615 [Streptomyces sp. PTY087I2]